MLPPGLERCPSCGKRLAKASPDEFSGKEILSYSLYIIGIVMIPILIIIAIGLVCAFLGSR